MKHDEILKIHIQKLKWYRIRSMESNELSNLDMSDADISDLIISFKEDYRNYLEYYSKSYPDIKICYGVVNYAH